MCIRISNIIYIIYTLSQVGCDISKLFYAEKVWINFTNLNWLKKCTLTQLFMYGVKFKKSFYKKIKANFALKLSIKCEINAKKFDFFEIMIGLVSVS